MNPALKDFFEEEKKRVFAPGEYFSTRVMARLREVQSGEFGIWDIVPGFTRPVIGAALVLILSFAAVQMLVPKEPEQGFVAAVLDAERSQTDAPFLYSGAEIPADHELLNQLMGFEDRR